MLYLVSYRVKNMTNKKFLKKIYIYTLCIFIISVFLSGCSSLAMSETALSLGSAETISDGDLGSNTESESESGTDIDAVNLRVASGDSYESQESQDDTQRNPTENPTESGESLESSGNADVINIKQDDEEETEEVVRMGVDSSILPILEGVTTAEDNTELAPVNLKVGDQHSVVNALQTRLMALGYMDNDETTTYYGTSTAEAIKKFQRQAGLTQDGVCGVETWDALFADSAAYYAVHEGDEGDDILLIQERLYELGYLRDVEIDGHFGPATETAVRDFQSRNGISVDGTVGKESINLLYSDEVQANLLGVGDESDLVGTYQQRLIELGYLRNEEADGAFGHATESAVREFQSRNDLIVDGYLGPSTVSTLMGDAAKPFGLRMGDESETVKTIQERLVHYGYLASRHATGYYGTITEAAVKQFQSQNGLLSDGVVGTQTMAALESDDAKKKPASLPSASSQTTGGDTGSVSSSGSSQSGGSDSATVSVGSGGATVSGAASSLIAIAQSKLGSPYVYGAKGPNSFDCSGFVYWCLNQAGVSQSYLTSSGWRNPGRYQRVSSFDSLQAGDIIVVSGHVGIVAGGGTVIDASASNGRVVHRQLSSWWRNNFIVGWRIFG